MVRRYLVGWMVLVLVAAPFAEATAEPTGSVRGMVYDKDFDVPLRGAVVKIVETGQETEATDQGNYVIPNVKPGTYTVVFAKPGYTRHVKTDMTVSGGDMTEVDAWLTGEFTEMEEFVVRDVEIGGGSEQAEIDLRMDAPALMDSISKDLMDLADVGDASEAMKLVAGATVQDGKYAVVRGLPDRYVSSQMNGVRLPTADADKRAVQLDQFPSGVIESIRVSKTFTPDQQGDASGGAVNVILTGIPNKRVIKFGFSSSVKEQVDGRDDFLTYRNGGVHNHATDHRNRDLPVDVEDAIYRGEPFTTFEDKVAQSELFSKVVGVTRDEARRPWSWSLTLGDRYEFDSGFRLGGVVSMYQKRSSSYYENGIDDRYIVRADLEEPKLLPYIHPTNGTSLYDVTVGKQKVQWGVLSAVGAGTEHHDLTTVYMLTQMAEDEAVLREDTRGVDKFREEYPELASDVEFYTRSQTLTYKERTTETLQIRGRHKFPFSNGDRWGSDILALKGPEFDWTWAESSAREWKPDQRLLAVQFIDQGDLWWQKRYSFPDTGSAGNAFHIWRDIEETSDQFFFNLKFPFTQWTNDEGYVKLGWFKDEVRRDYEQDSFVYDGGRSFMLDARWEEFWSETFTDDPDRVLLATGVDIDYQGRQDIDAMYYMVDLPVCSFLNVIAGARYESTKLAIQNTMAGGQELRRVLLETEDGAVHFQDVTVDTIAELADAAYQQDDILPSTGFVLHPIKGLNIRASVSETVARPTFKELSPISQQEYVGDDLFVGNPDVRMSSLRNEDIRVEYTPEPGSLYSVSWFRKEITDPIEYYQGRNAGVIFTRSTNYPDGWLEGYEFEVRQGLGRFWSPLKGLSVGANATLIESEVTVPDRDRGTPPGELLPPTRDMMGTPEHLYNVYMTYNNQELGTKAGLFYTITGDTLVAGASKVGVFTPNVYAKEYRTLNFTLSQKIGKNVTLSFAAKNLLDPKIQEVYRAPGIPGEAVKASYREGVEYSVGVSVTF